MIQIEYNLTLMNLTVNNMNSEQYFYNYSAYKSIKVILSIVYEIFYTLFWHMEYKISYKLFIF